MFLRCLLAVLLVVAASSAVAGPMDGYFDEDSAKGYEGQGLLFTKTLYDGYVALSDSRNTGFDMADAELFNHKARSVLRRSATHSDAVMDRTLESEDRRTFTLARMRLHAAFDRGARELAPVEVGTAQVAYDCWIEATEGKRENDAAECRARFEDAIAAAEQKANYELMVIEVPEPAIPAPQPQVAAAPTPAPLPPQEYYLIYFEFDKTIMTPEGERNMRQAINDLEDYQTLDIALRAHADRSGSDSYNKDLSRRRAEAVLTRLMSAGIDTSRLRIVEAVGESRPLVPTGDGVKEQGNRVVEIDLRQYNR